MVEGDVLDEEDIVLERQEATQDLREALVLVRKPNTASWNLHKTDIGPKKMLPIHVLF